MCLCHKTAIFVACCVLHTHSMEAAPHVYVMFFCVQKIGRRFDKMSGYLSCIKTKCMTCNNGTRGACAREVLYGPIKTTTRVPLLRVQHVPFCALIN